MLGALWPIDTHRLHFLDVSDNRKTVLPTLETSCAAGAPLLMKTPPQKILVANSKIKLKR